MIIYFHRGYIICRIRLFMTEVDNLRDWTWSTKIHQIIILVIQYWKSKWETFKERLLETKWSAWQSVSENNHHFDNSVHLHLYPYADNNISIEQYKKSAVRKDVLNGNEAITVLMTTRSSTMVVVGGGDGDGDGDDYGVSKSFQFSSSFRDSHQYIPWHNVCSVNCCYSLYRNVLMAAGATEIEIWH